MKVYYKYGSILVIILIFFIISCPEESEIYNIPIKNVYYGERMVNTVKQYILGIDVDESEVENIFGNIYQYDNFKWKDYCLIENNEITGESNNPATATETLPFNVPFIIQLKKALIPAADAGKQIFFNTDRYFTVSFYPDSVFPDKQIKCKLGTSSLIINFTPFVNQ